MTTPLMILFFAAAVTVAEPTPIAAYSIEPCMSSVAQKPFDDQACLDVLAQAREQVPLNEGAFATIDQQASPDTARAHAALAVGYAMNNELDAADQHQELALRLAAHDWHTLANSGVVHLYRARFEQAHLELTQAMASHPDFPPYLLLNRSLALRALGRFVESAQDVHEYRQLMGFVHVADEPCAINSPDCRSALAVGPHPVR